MQIGLAGGAAPGRQPLDAQDADAPMRDQTQDIARAHQGVCAIDPAAVEPDMALFAQRLKAAPPNGRPLLMFQMQQFLLRAKDKAAAFGLMERVLQPYLKFLFAEFSLSRFALQFL